MTTREAELRKRIEKLEEIVNNHILSALAALSQQVRELDKRLWGLLLGIVLTILSIWGSAFIHR